MIGRVFGCEEARVVLCGNRPKLKVDRQPRCHGSAAAGTNELASLASALNARLTRPPLVSWRVMVMSSTVLSYTSIWSIGMRP